MPSHLTAPPALEPVTLAEAKAHLRVLHADEDQLIGRLIEAARRRVESAAGLKLIQQGWSVYYDDWPDDGALELPLAPILAIADVKVHGEDGGAAVIDPAHYVADRFSRPPRLLLRPDRLWARPGRLANGVEVAVTAGFGAAAPDVPEPLRQAMLHLIAHAYANRGEAAALQAPLAFSGLIAPYRELRL
jgi:uncharacterized phiE125 gp8 family phage protein